MATNGCERTMCLLEHTLALGSVKISSIRSVPGSIECALLLLTIPFLLRTIWRLWATFRSRASRIFSSFEDGRFVTSHDPSQLLLTISSLAEDAKESSVNVFSEKVIEVVAECVKNQRLKTLLHRQLQHLPSPQSIARITGIIRYQLLPTKHNKDNLLRAITIVALTTPASVGRTLRIRLSTARSRVTIQGALAKPVPV
jgi:hypothetical protein